MTPLIVLHGHIHMQRHLAVAAVAAVSDIKRPVMRRALAWKLASIQRPPV